MMLSQTSTRLARQSLATSTLRNFAISNTVVGSKRTTSGCYNLGFAVVVGQEYAVMLHRFEKFDRQLEPGLSFKIPVIDKVQYVHDLRE